jgi:hypothetical protein
MAGERGVARRLSLAQVREHGGLAAYQLVQKRPRRLVLGLEVYPPVHDAKPGALGLERGDESGRA